MTNKYAVDYLNLCFDLVENERLKYLTIKDVENWLEYEGYQNDGLIDVTIQSFEITYYSTKSLVSALVTLDDDLELSIGETDYVITESSESRAVVKNVRLSMNDKAVKKFKIENGIE